MSSEPNTDRTAVKTYVPSYQKSEWKRHADDLDMSQSEFVRTMVQAGRRGFTTGGESNPEEGDEEGSNPGGNGLESRVESVLSRKGPLSWEDLLDALSGDLEERLENALDDLQSEDRVRYSGREGGYVLTDGER
ncbi:DUF5805 domain-containing protein [Haloparvum sedimenti]|uniref:DUF5805 domain-containing protein n=1 Tax=Haloparvum sedimenti TaxID=1678448 RepID=UPI00071E9323|nr:DUF5805 domain-containing protein [Haloparvum sedimenti]